MFVGWQGRGACFKGVALLAVTGLVFFLLFRKIEFTAVAAVVTAVPCWVLLAGTAMVCVLPGLLATRWWLTLRGLGHPIAWRKCLPIILGILPVNAISPSKAGDLLRVIGLRGRVPGATVVGGLLVERSVDMMVLALLSGIGGVFLGQQRIVAIAALVLAVVAMGLVVSSLAHRLPLPERLGVKLRELSNAVRRLSAQPARLVYIVVLTMGHWLIAVGLVMVLFHGAGADVTFIHTLAALPVAIFVGTVPITFGGMGTRDAAIVYLFAASTTTTQALAVGLLYTIFTYWLLGFLGLPFIRKALGH